LSDRTQFLVGYAERRLGRELTEDEKTQFEGLLTRRQAADLADSLKVKPKKAKPKKSKWTPSEDESMDTTIEKVVNDEV